MQPHPELKQSPLLLELPTPELVLMMMCIKVNNKA